MKLPWSLRVRFALRQHGWPAWLGFFLLCASGLLFGMADAERQATDGLQAQLRAQRERLLRAPAQDPAVNASAALAEFQRALPGTDATVQVVDLLHSSAARHGVTLASGEYRLLSDGQQGLRRYQITLPAAGNYPALRAWLADALNAQPALALDELTLAREAAESPLVEARVRWSLYFVVPQ
ncbi:GspMb/PilO family protein [Hydrogenophaga sp.]|uniref:GspMb/PilO family protein n=1 Tax=Hydrogenophaga sp. TaxID=1904254 RepID=UPI002626C0D2|nr:GspMb/PilO family protein [Hydrogenophaga sp.]MDM7948588.1 GspMb/PilO family protein [Hydrogenophaga sp.]